MTHDGYFKMGDITMLDVLESACIGVEDELSGEAVKLFVVKDLTVNGSIDIKKDDIINFCRKNLTAYKIPREVIFLDEIPK